MTTIDLSQPFSYRPATAAFASAAAILAGLAFVFVTSNLLAPAFATGGWNLYLVQPLLWLGLAALCLRLAPDLLRRPAALILSVALLAGLFEVALFAIAGLLYGFGRSTFAHETLRTLAKLFYIGSALFGAETARAYLLRRWLRHGWPAVIVVALLFAALTLSLSQLQTLTQADAGSFTVVGGSFLPDAVDSLLATVLVAAGGPWAGIAYRAVPLLVEWLSPVLPQLHWTLSALVGVLAAGIALLALRPVVGAPGLPGTNEARRRAIPAWVLAIGTTLVGVIWLNTGLLGVRPALVSGVSMEPNLGLGDIVLTRPVDSATLRAGDVIRFRSGDISIVHRIVAVKATPAGLLFQTQGDNNNFADPPVPAADIEGKVMLRLPKLGLLPIALRTWLHEATS